MNYLSTYLLSGLAFANIFTRRTDDLQITTGFWDSATVSDDKTHGLRTVFVFLIVFYRCEMLWLCWIGLVVVTCGSVLNILRHSRNLQPDDACHRDCRQVKNTVSNTATQRLATAAAAAVLRHRITAPPSLLVAVIVEADVDARATLSAQQEV